MITDAVLQCFGSFFWYDCFFCIIFCTKRTLSVVRCNRGNRLDALLDINSCIVYRCSRG